MISTISNNVHITSAPDLADLMDALYHEVADKWKPIDIYHHLPMATLDTIAAENQNDPHKCPMAMLDAWLNRVEPNRLYFYLVISPIPRPSLSFPFLTVLQVMESWVGACERGYLMITVVL